MAIIDVAELTVTPAALAPPIETVAPDTNPVPVIVTAVPPLVDPELGEIAVTVGAA